MSATTLRRQVRRLGVALAALSIVGTAAACGGSTTSAGSSASGSAAAPTGEFTFWDPYPQYDDTSTWVKTIQACAPSGVTVKRTAYDTSDLTSKALLAGQQGTSPDVLLVDNPVISTLADAGVLTTSDDTGLDVTPFEANLIGAGQVDGKTYGVPIGANTLALYYNPKVLQKAGVDPTSVTDWTSLTAALAKVKASGGKGITFSAIGTEEGSFQFLPWFWGAGAQLTQLDSPQAVSALQLWTDWVEKGYAPNSVLNNTQTTSWQEFQSGDFAFSENGTWQKADAAKRGYEVMAIPGATGGAAPAPTGGEFLSIPVQKDTARYAVSKQIVSCLTDSANIAKTDDSLNYIAPTQAAQQAQLASDPSLKTWVAAVGAAKGRTADDLGTKYPPISEQLWGAVQKALTRSQSPQEALTAAQAAVGQ